MRKNEPEADARDRVGRVLKEKWRLDAILGVGGFGAVYAATHRTGSRVAVKMLHSDLTKDEQVRGRFLREAYVANRIRHPGVVSILDDDTLDDGTPFLVMELLEGQTFEQRGAACGFRMDPREALWIADRLLEVLAAAHAQGIIHRDIKPENVFITQDGRLKVLDFGVARLREGSKLGTAMGLTMGTVAFMPPEQARGDWDQVDARSDLFAVGASLFSVFAGRLLHLGNPADSLRSAMTRQAPQLATLAPQLAGPVAELVDRALAFHPSGRFADALAMQRAVREAYLHCAGVALAPATWTAAVTTGTSGRAPVVRVNAPSPPRPGGDGTFGDELTAAGAALTAVPFELSRSKASPARHVEPSRAREASRDALADAYVNRGLSKYAAGDLNGAIADFTSALELLPGHALAHFDRGVAWQAKGEVEEAILDYGRAIDRRADLAEAFYNRAWVLQARGELERATSDAQRARDLFAARNDPAGVRAAEHLVTQLIRRP